VKNIKNQPRHIDETYSKMENKEKCKFRKILPKNNKYKKN
jgi:hypothetical protein